KRSGDADLLVVMVRFVVEVLELRLGGDRCVDFLLSRDARLPPVSVQLPRGIRPLGLGVARDLPLFPLLLERGVQLRAQRLERLLPLLPDDVDLRVVRDRLEGDVRYALVDEALADVAARGLR